MIYASFWRSCCKVSLDNIVDYDKFWHAIFMILLVWTPRHEMDCATMGGPKELCVSLKITQLMLHKFTVDENADQREISVKS